MDENQVRQIAEDVVRQNEAKNQYTVAKIPVHKHNNIDSPFVSFSDIENAPNNFCISVKTSGTTPVPVFGTNGSLNGLTITGFFATSLDTTAGTIAILNAGGTVGTLQKGTIAGTMIGSINVLTGTVATFTLGNTLTVTSSSAGNAQVFIVYVV